MDAAWLEKLNADQRLAATYGAGKGEDRTPLLVIAGAG